MKLFIAIFIALSLHTVIFSQTQENIEKKSIHIEGKSSLEIVNQFTSSLLNGVPNGSVIGVLPFEDKTDVGSSVSQALGEGVVAHLSSNSSYVVVDKSKLSKAIDEVSLSQTGITNREITMGNIMTADYLIVGTITDAFGKKLVSGTMLKVETGETVNAVQMVLGASNVSDISKELLKEKTSPMSYVARSLLLPGWGQMYGDRTVRGGVFMAAGLGCLGFTVYKWIDTDSKNSDYKSFSSMIDNKTEYDTWLSENELIRGEEANSKFTEESEAYYKEYSDSQDMAVIMSSVTAGVWVLNVVDAFFVGRSESSKFTRYFSSVVPQKDGFMFAYHF